MNVIVKVAKFCGPIELLFKIMHVLLLMIGAKPLVNGTSITDVYIEVSWHVNGKLNTFSSRPHVYCLQV